MEMDINEFNERSAKLKAIGEKYEAAVQSGNWTQELADELTQANNEFTAWHSQFFYVP